MAYESKVVGAPGRLYAASFEATAVSTVGAFDLIGLTPSSSSRVVLHDIELSYLSTNVQTSEQILAISVYRGSTAASTSAAITPVNYKGHATAPAAVSAVTAPSSELVSTASASLLHIGVLDADGFRYNPWPENRPMLDVSQRLHVRVAVPAAAISVVGTLIFEEIGKLPS